MLITIIQWHPITRTPDVTSEVLITDGVGISGAYWIKKENRFSVTRIFGFEEVKNPTHYAYIDALFNFYERTNPKS